MFFLSSKLVLNKNKNTVDKPFYFIFLYYKLENNINYILKPHLIT